ncbi:MAG: acetylornithine transaminase [Actinobacteria bacterium]|nr:acetylornithine transaminase [Actinomycetota bacterium]
MSPSYSPQSVVLDHGKGMRVWDREGKEYLDFLGGIAVLSLGHAHPAMVAALTDQISKLTHISNIYFSEPQILLQEELVRRTFADRVFFCNSGAEANEAAIKLARRHARIVQRSPKFELITLEGSFHGRTLGALAATGQPAKWEGFQPLPEGFRHVVWNDLEAIEAAIDPTVAAIMLEPIQGEGGVNPATAAYFEGVRRLCDEHGLLFIVDEIQTGLGRTGEWFGFQHFGIEPDVVMMAKALGNGMPIGACWARREVAAAFRAGDHGTTYGGQPLAASAARATLAIMERENAPQLAEHAGSHLRAALSSLPAVTEVRGLGLLLAAQLAEGLDARAVVADALAAGLVLNAVSPSSIRFAPPLVVAAAEIDEAVAILAEVLGRHGATS